MPRKHPARNIPILVGRSPDLYKELERMRARRMAIATVIESLEEYDRLRLRRYAEQRLRTA